MFNIIKFSLLVAILYVDDFGISVLIYCGGGVSLLMSIFDISVLMLMFHFNTLAYTI